MRTFSSNHELVVNFIIQLQPVFTSLFHVSRSFSSKCPTITSICDDHLDTWVKSNSGRGINLTSFFVDAPSDNQHLIMTLHLKLLRFLWDSKGHNHTKFGLVYSFQFSDIS